MTVPDEISTSRDHVEAELRDQLGDHLRPIGPELLEVLDAFADGSFGTSYLSMLLYCNGWNRGSFSNDYPQGLVFHGDDTLFGLGCFATDAPRPGHGGRNPGPFEAAGHEVGYAQLGGVHLVAPRGASAEKTAARVAAVCKEHFPDLLVYARHLDPEAYETFLASGRWLPIDVAPWDPQAPSEDETYCHRRIRLSDLVEVGKTGYHVRILEGDESRQFRRKARLAHNRFRNFLQREQVSYRLVAHSAAQVDAARRVVTEHFDHISSSRRVIGSSAADYENLVRFTPAAGDRRFFCRVGWLEGDGWRRPASFFASEELAEGVWGCYSTITRRDPALLPAAVEDRGFSAIAQYALLEMFAELYRHGAREVDLGGSETPQLDRFKRQLGARHLPTHWAVYHGS